VVVVLAALVWYTVRSRALRQRFGPEYDRAVAEGDGRLAAERELRERERRHAELELRELSPESRERYRSGWEDVQRQFVDDPSGAVRAADSLVTELVAERGYPTGNYDEQVAQLSVEHAETLGRYRAAHDISEGNARGEATTEQLRQAVVHFRALFAELLGEEPVPAEEPEPVEEETRADEPAAVEDETRAGEEPRAEEETRAEAPPVAEPVPGAEADQVRAEEQARAEDAAQADGRRA
jgi:hypothetical protein